MPWSLDLETFTPQPDNCLLLVECTHAHYPPRPLPSPQEFRQLGAVDIDSGVASIYIPQARNYRYLFNGGFFWARWCWVRSDGARGPFTYQLVSVT